jgi:hypothetical protein
MSARFVAAAAASMIGRSKAAIGVRDIGQGV